MPKTICANPQNLEGTSEVNTETAVVKRVNDPVPALAALYQGEKTDASSVFYTAMAMMGIAVTYLIGAIPSVSNLSHGPIPWLFLLLLPLPVWLIVAFHSLMTLNAMSHGISVRIIEQALFEVSELRVESDLVGSAAGDKIMDITKSKAAHKLITVVVYGGVFLMVVGFTAYVLYSANLIIKNDAFLVHARVIWIAMGIYSLRRWCHFERSISRVFSALEILRHLAHRRMVSCYCLWAEIVRMSLINILVIRIHVRP